MDFNEIKHTWKSSFSNKEQLRSTQIESLLKISKESNTALSKLKNNNKNSLILLTAMYIIAIFFIIRFIQLPEALKPIIVFTTIMGTGFYFSFRSYKRIKNTVFTNERLKSALQKTIHEVERNVKFGTGQVYKFILIPLALILGIAIGIYIAKGDRTFIETLYELEKQSIIKIIIVVIVGSGLAITYSQILIKRLYKKHLDELKRCLKEFEEEITHQKELK